MGWVADAVGIVPHADRAGAEPDRLAGTERAGALDQHRIDRERLGDRDVVGGMHGRGDAEEDEVAGRAGRVAVELGEVGGRAGADLSRQSQRALARRPDRRSAASPSGSVWLGRVLNSRRGETSRAEGCRPAEPISRSASAASASGLRAESTSSTATRGAALPARTRRRAKARLRCRDFRDRAARSGFAARLRATDLPRPDIVDEERDGRHAPDRCAEREPGGILTGDAVRGRACLRR